MRVCITGGTGFIGSKLTELFQASGHEVVVLDLTKPKKELAGVTYRAVNLLKEPVPEVVSTCDAIVHLAGVSIFNRWTPPYKKLILDSRVKTGEALIAEAQKPGSRVKTFVSASAVGFYGEGGEQVLTETSPAGTDFLASVCVAWEHMARSAEAHGMRSVSIRTGIVIGPDGGMMSKLVPIFKFGLGGRLGSGKQWFSWIHLKDLLAVYYQAVTDDRLRGPINAVSPGAVRNSEFTHILAEKLHRPAFWWIPGFMLHAVLGEFAGAVLASQHVVPQKLTDIHFVFAYPTVDSALSHE
jgi:uncharacterized protein (TIGR01777 family)